MNHSHLKKILLSILMVAWALPIAAQTTPIPKAKLANSFALEFQSNAVVRANDVSATFVGYQDQRCPNDLLCIHGGHAFGLRFCISQLEPRPVRFSPPTKAPYVVQFTVETADGSQECQALD
jgi:hypothetical protein